MNGGIVRFTHNSALFRHLDLIEYSVLNCAATQTNISYRQSCTLCSMPEALIYASNEPKSVLARDLGDCRVNQNWSTGPILDTQSEKIMQEMGLEPTRSCDLSLIHI